MAMRTRSLHDTTLSRWRILGLIIFPLALISLIYAVATAPGRGIDVMAFQAGAREWMTGEFQIGAGPIGEYPPFALPLFSPLASMSRETLITLWIGLNIAATILVMYLANKLWAKQWPVEARFCLFAGLLASAPFRVTVRNGQISLMIMALLMGALLARSRKMNILAGVLLGISLCKYSMTLPFLLYFAWKREWKIVFTALLIPAALTQVFAWRLGLSLTELAGQYIDAISNAYVSSTSVDAGTSEIKLLLLALTGENESLTTILTVAFSLAALISMAIVFARKPHLETMHFAALALFALWTVYHRTYDYVLCLFVAVALVDSLIKRRFAVTESTRGTRRLMFFNRFRVAALGLLIISISIPGVLVDRLKLSPPGLSGNLLLFLGVHIERLLIFGMFWSLLVFIWKSGDTGNFAESKVNNTVEETAAVSHSFS